MIKKQTLTKQARTLWVASALLFPFITPSAAALVSIGDYAEIFFNGSASVRYNDNLFLNESNERSDTIFILSPGVELNVGQRANANLNIYYREDFYLYDKNSRLDTNTTNVFLESFWNQSRLDLRFDASYEELIQTTPDIVRLNSNINDLVEREQTRANLRGEYEISELTSASAGIGYSKLDFKSPGFSDREIITIPLNAYYSVTPLVDLSIGYRFRDADVSDQTAYTFNGTPIPSRSRSDYQDHYFNIGARGELAPKLMGEARAGYQYRDIKDGGSKDTLSFSADVSHFTTANTTLLVGLFRDFDISVEGESTTRTGGNLGVRHTFSHLISGSAGAHYYERSYNGGRKDKTIDVHVGATYSPITYLDLSATYVFRHNDSNIKQVEFDNNIFSVSAALRY